MARRARTTVSGRVTEKPGGYSPLQKFEMYQELLSQPEFPLHPGTISWQHRDDPFLTSEDVQGIESLRSLGLSLRDVGRALDDPGAHDDAHR